MADSVCTAENTIFRVVGLIEEGGKVITTCELLPNYAATFDPKLNGDKLGESLMEVYTSNRVKYINQVGRIIKNLAIGVWQDELSMAKDKDRLIIEKKMAELNNLKFKLVSDAPEYISEAYFLSSLITLVPTIVPVIQGAMEYTGILYTEDKVLTNRESNDEP